MELQQSQDLTTKLSTEKEVKAKEELHNIQLKLNQALGKRSELEETVVKLHENVSSLSHTINEVQKDKVGLVSKYLFAQIYKLSSGQLTLPFMHFSYASGPTMLKS